MRIAVKRGSQLAGSVHFRIGSGAWKAVRFFNLSITGCVLMIDGEALTEATTIWLRFEGFSSLAARVEWRTEDQTSVEFHSTLHEAIIDHILLSSI